MSNEALVGIIVTVVIGLASFLVVTNKKSIKISQKSKNGNNNLNNNSISNEIYKDNE